MVECVSDCGEEGLLLLIKTCLDNDRVRPVGIGDDAAVIAKNWTGAMVLAADAMVEDVHFTRALCPGDSVARKLIDVNLSDLAAMGARGEFGLLTVSFPGTLAWSWVEAFFRGLSQRASQVDLAIAGGDVTGSQGPIYLSMSVVGECVASRALRRSTAQPGDYVYVTGSLGSAAFGLHTLRNEPDRSAERPHSIRAYREPVARMDQGHALARWGECHAVMDISDGLYRDAQRMATASGVLMELDLTSLPIHSELASQPRTLVDPLAIAGGEDYELLFTCALDPPIEAHRIGRVIAGDAGVRWVSNDQEVVLPFGDSVMFDHFNVG